MMLGEWAKNENLRISDESSKGGKKTKKTPPLLKT